MRDQLTQVLHVVLIKATRYDDDGYPMRHWRGVLPSNTLACLVGLTEAVHRQKVLGEGIEIRRYMYDEGVHNVPLRQLARLHRPPRERVVVGFVGVQSNQFPRACDLARAFQREGVQDILLGGFHVSGSIALADPGSMPAEIQYIMDEGITVVKGEVEDHWGQILKDIVEDRRQRLYDFGEPKPDMSLQPLPVVDREYLKHFMQDNFATLDLSRGCIWDCEFCCIINVHGKTMRHRDAEHIAETIRRNYALGVDFYFFTDDNLARAKNWEAFFDMLIRLREEEGIALEFMIQADIPSYRMKHFIPKARKAGCTKVFLGVESLDAETLQAAGKRQNVAANARDCVAAYEAAGIGTHAGYIIGFPTDTYESVMRSIEQLMQEVKPSTASFFMLTPLPGSMDHVNLRKRGEWMAEDFNLYDSFHETTHHPHLQDGLWTKAYQEAWDRFYSYDNMKAILLRTQTEASYWNTFKNLLWYKSSFFVYREHPMISGFFRLKGRKLRRPGLPIQPVWVYWPHRVAELAGEYHRWWLLFTEFKNLWLETRKESLLERYALEKLARLRDDVASRLPHTSDPHLQAHLAQAAQEWGQFVMELERLWRSLRHMPGLKLMPRLQGLWEMLSQTATQAQGRADQVRQQLLHDVRTEIRGALQRSLEECEAVREKLQALRHRSLFGEARRALQFVRCLGRNDWSLEVVPFPTEQISH
ncbi:MAG: B12-binding domain-containing radical SAM protein [Nitrospinae bacterium]|nr:B12-binding domain-containing radical SAM protein [Nitrospinota bacterium]